MPKSHFKSSTSVQGTKTSDRLNILPYNISCQSSKSSKISHDKRANRLTYKTNSIAILACQIRVFGLFFLAVVSWLRGEEIA